MLYCSFGYTNLATKTISVIGILHYYPFCLFLFTYTTLHFKCPCCLASVITLQHSMYISSLLLCFDSLSFSCWQARANPLAIRHFVQQCPFSQSHPFSSCLYVSSKLIFFLFLIMILASPSRFYFIHVYYFTWTQFACILYFYK